MAGEMLTLPSLTLHAPWAYAVAHLSKRIENRTWTPPAKLLGQRLAIHAGATDGPGEWTQVYDTVPAMRLPPLPRLDPQPARSAVVAVVTVAGMLDARTEHDMRTEGAGSVGMAFDPWWIGPVGWLLRDVVTLPEPVPCKGRLGVWRLPADVDAKVRAQLAQTEAA